MYVKYSESVLKKLRKGTSRSAGYDIASTEDVVVPPGCSRKIGTGVSVALPSGYMGILVHRSGMNSKKGAWAYGTIDEDYRGELFVTLYNLHPNTEIRIGAGEYFAQIIPTPCYRGALMEAKNLDKTERGDGGHGSTGA